MMNSKRLVQPVCSEVEMRGGGPGMGGVMRRVRRAAQGACGFFFFFFFGVGNLLFPAAQRRAAISFIKSIQLLKFQEFQE